MIILYGKLKKLYGPSIDSKVNSVKELMQAAEANKPGFRHSIDKARNYIIRRGDEFRTAKDVGEEEIDMRFSEDTWHILPMPIGHSGWARVVGGAVLVVVGAVMNAYTGFVGGTPLMTAGIGLMVGGVASLLAPVPNISNYGDRESPGDRPSFLFDGPTNKAAVGGAVPLVFGFNVYVGSTFVSGGIDVGVIV